MLVKKKNNLYRIHYVFSCRTRFTFKWSLTGKLLVLLFSFIVILFIETQISFCVILFRDYQLYLQKLSDFIPRISVYRDSDFIPCISIYRDLEFIPCISIYRDYQKQMRNPTTHLSIQMMSKYTTLIHTDESFPQITGLSPF